MDHSKTPRGGALRLDLLGLFLVGLAHLLLFSNNPGAREVSGDFFLETSGCEKRWKGKKWYPKREASHILPGEVRKIIDSKGKSLGGYEICDRSQEGIQKRVGIQGSLVFPMGFLSMIP